MQILIVILSIWSVFWKAVALWRASRSEQRIWFIVLFIFFIVNSIGIFELIYLFKFAKKPLTLSEIRTWPKMLSRKNKNK